MPYLGLPAETELTCPYCGQPGSMGVQGIEDNEATNERPRTAVISLFCRACDHAVLLKIDGQTIGAKLLEGFRHSSNLQRVSAAEEVLLQAWH